MKVKPMLGSFALDSIEYIESSESRALVEHRVPGLEGSYFQDMGSVPNTIVIAGTKHGDEPRETFLEGIREIFNAGKPTTFVADINTATDITEVVIEDLQVAEVANSPNNFRYMIKIRKYIKPPEPPATGLLDGGILDDALSLTDALDLIDGLGSIPDLGDPTRPLRQALDGIKSGTSGLDQTVNDLQNLFGEEPPAPEDLHIDPADPRIAGATGAALQSMLESPETAALAAALIQGVNQGKLTGIFDNTSPEAAALAAAHGLDLSELIPAGQDAVLVLDALLPLDAPPTIILRREVRLEIDPADSRFGERIGPVLQSLLEDSETSEIVAPLIEGIHQEKLSGIFSDDSPAAQQLAAAHGLVPSELIPTDQDAVLVLDAASPLDAPPMILVKPEVHKDSARLGTALGEVGQTFALFQRGELGPCDSPSEVIPVPNLAPSTFCHVLTGVTGIQDQGVCRISERILFDTASSFIVPTADHKRVYDSVVDRIVRGPATNLLFAVGHTDDTGPQGLNELLSERRAAGALAVLTADIGVWEANFRNEKKVDSSPPWGDADFRQMLLEVNGTQPGAAEIQQHRALTAAGAVLRADLFRAYFLRLLGNPTSPITVRSATPTTLGCGEHHALASGDHRPSRRVEFFFVLGGSTPMISCNEYPTWTNICSAIPLPPVVPSTVSFFVSDTGDDASGDGSKTKPWRTIKHALDERLNIAGQPVTIGVLRGTFPENVFLPSKTTLEGMSDPLPVVSGTDANKPTIEVYGGSNSKIKKLRIQNGTDSGIRIRNAKDIEVSGCEIRENFGPRGGGIAVIDSDIVDIDDNEIALNTAGTIATAVTRLVLNGSLIPPEITAFEIDIGDAHGGGTYLENSGDVRITNNRIHNNTAILFGGGIAVDNEAGFTEFIEISDNQIFCNQVSHGDLTDLEAPEIFCSAEDMADPLLDRVKEETWDLIAAEAVRALHGVGVENGLGGGVALRHVSPQTRLLRNLIGARRTGDGTQGAPNRARRGGGIECYIGAYPRIEENTVAYNLTSDDGGGIAIDQFDPFLPDNQTQFFCFRRAAMIARQTINLVNNSVCFNRTLEDGGGMYATGNPLVNITGSRTLIEGNRAQENGGGVRVSYAARLTMQGARVLNNVANVGAKGEEGGGGLAARNAAVSLEDCVFEGNVATEFAGGAIYCNSAFERGFSAGGFQKKSQYGQYDRIMERDYGFSTRTCVLKNCSGSENQATDESGAGGYLYAVHVEGEQPLYVTLDGASTAIGENQSEYTKEARRKRGNVVVEFNGQERTPGLPIALGGLPNDEVTIHGAVPSPPTGIANSRPSPDNRPVVIIHGGTRVDDHPTSFPYTNRPPRIDQIAPPFGALAGGTNVVISGSGFLPNLTVSFGATNPSPQVQFVSSMEIHVTTPPAPPGQTIVGVTAMNPDGQAHLLIDGFEYVGPPKITAVIPSAGAFIGGTKIEVDGSGFRDELDLFIGGQPADVIEVQTNQVKAMTPPGSVGQVDVYVANRDQQSDLVSDGFTYVDPPPPIVYGFLPRSGPATGGTTVTVTGQNFLREGGGSIVLFGAVSANTTFISDQELHAVTPQLAPQTVLVSVFNPDGDSSPPGGDFRFDPPPDIQVLVPPSAPTVGQEDVIIQGANFQQGVDVELSAGTVSLVQWLSDTEIRMLVDGGPAGPVDITVRNPDNQEDTIQNGFNFVP
jgi:predicted outer membrane repeat protein